MQIGTPSDIYDRPADRFVAGFVGSVNLFDGVVAATNAGLATVECPELAASLLAPARGFAPGECVALAIRPERIRLNTPSGASTPRNRFEGTVVSHAFAGEKRMYRVAIGNGVVLQVSQSSGDADARHLVRDDPVAVEWEPAASILVRP